VVAHLSSVPQRKIGRTGSAPGFWIAVATALLEANPL
jgi:hypothetical protein